MKVFRFQTINFIVSSHPNLFREICQTYEMYKNILCLFRGVFAIRSHSYREPDEGMGQTQILVPLDGNVFIEHLKGQTQILVPLNGNVFIEHLKKG